MKARVVFFLAILVSLTSCKGGEFSDPESTFRTLVTSVQSRDLETYSKCWAPGRETLAGEVEFIRHDPSKWDELVEVTKGELSLTLDEEWQKDGETFRRYKVNSNPQTRLVSVRLTLVGENWLMDKWRIDR